MPLKWNENQEVLQANISLYLTCLRSCNICSSDWNESTHQGLGRNHGDMLLLHNTSDNTTRKSRNLMVQHAAYALQHQNFFILWITNSRWLRSVQLKHFKFCQMEIFQFSTKSLNLQHKKGTFQMLFLFNLALLKPTLL